MAGTSSAAAISMSWSRVRWGLNIEGWELSSVYIISRTAGSKSIAMEFDTGEGLGRRRGMPVVVILLRGWRGYEIMVCAVLNGIKSRVCHRRESKEITEIRA